MFKKLSALYRNAMMGVKTRAMTSKRRSIAQVKEAVPKIQETKETTMIKKEADLYLLNNVYVKVKL